MVRLTDQRIGELLLRLREDYPLFASQCLVILDKNGKTIPFEFNKAQIYLHQAIEEQISDIGRVRALLLKGRQQGGSTYIGGRFYHKTSMRCGQKAFIMAHEQAASDNLYGMVKRFHANSPVAPPSDASNAKELLFSGMDSGYKVATAGSKDTGRSSTVRLLHGSEMAFWANAGSHIASIAQAVPELPGTEIIYESTGNGVGTPFHEMWQDAERGNNDYKAIFLPWFWQPEYRLAVPEDFEPTSDEQIMRITYGLDMEQVVWYRTKRQSFRRGEEWMVKQEYPCTPNEAFRSSTTDPLISPDIVAKAVASNYIERNGPLVVGCDPAEYGPDRTSFVWRQGRLVLMVESFQGRGPMEIAGMLAKRWSEGHEGLGKPDAMFVDRIGIGAGIVDRLRELSIPHIGVNSAEKAENDADFINQRAEMWWRMREWFMDEPVRIPPDSGLQADLSAPGYKDHSTSGRRQVESKDDMRKRGVRSPDNADALALTFNKSVGYRNQSSGRSSGYRPATSAGY